MPLSQVSPSRNAITCFKWATRCQMQILGKYQIYSGCKQVRQRHKYVDGCFNAKNLFDGVQVSDTLDLEIFTRLGFFPSVECESASTPMN
jgi:hypothetical protein